MSSPTAAATPTPIDWERPAQPARLHLAGSVMSSQPAIQKKLSVSVVSPVRNQRHVLGASLARVLAVESEYISRLELIVVDDASNDGSWDMLEELARSDDRVRLLRHSRPYGRTAAIRAALELATGDVCLVHEAGMSYNPADIPGLLRPFLDEGADAVFGSRYLPSQYRLVPRHRRTLLTASLTRIANWLTDLNLTDVETGYKAINTRLLKSLPLRSRDLGFEIEVVFKLAKRRARVFEAPVRYLPRPSEEGGRLRWRDGLTALGAMIKYTLADDVYSHDKYGSNILNELQNASRFNRWMADTLRPYVGNRVLEIGAGIGNLTDEFIPRDLYVASDINPEYLNYLKSYSIGKPYLQVANLDVGDADAIRPFAGSFDTVLIINVLEHVPDERLALKNLHTVLRPGGRAVILVPQHPKLYNSLDVALEHRERYTAAGLRSSLEQSGFRVENLIDFNRVSVPGWFINGGLLRRKHLSAVQLKVLEWIMPAVRRLDGLLPWKGISIIGVGVKE